MKMKDRDGCMSGPRELARDDSLHYRFLKIPIFLGRIDPNPLSSGMAFAMMAFDAGMAYLGRESRIGPSGAGRPPPLRSDAVKCEDKEMGVESIRSWPEKALRPSSEIR
jgi:hypothetical protein